MIYSNLPNQINNFSFLGRVNKEVELKVRAPSLGYPHRTEVLVWWVFPSLWAEVEMWRQAENGSYYIIKG